MKSIETNQLKTMKNEKRYWQGEIENCDICEKPMTNKFVDGPTKMGSWANMCEYCADRFWRYPMGETYEKQSDGRWLKIRG
jgi:hypothetical protein